MEITEITINLRSEDKLKAFVNVTFDRCFVVHGMKIIQRDDSFFVSMPSRRTENGEFKDIVHPISHEFRIKLEQAIIAEYHRVIERTREGGAG